MRSGDEVTADSSGYAALVTDLLRDRVADSAECVPLRTYGGGELTYRQWHLDSNVVARELLDRGVVAGDRIGLAFTEPDWNQYATAYLGVLKAGAIAVPVSARLGRDHRVRALTETGVRLLVGDPIAGPWGCVDYSDLAAGPAAGDVQVHVPAGQAAHILRTSGSTGAPKPVCVSHACLTGMPDFGDRAEFSASPGIILHATPITTSAAHKRLIQVLTMASITLLTLPRFDPVVLVRAVEENNVARLSLAPAAIVAMWRAACVPEGGLPNITRVSLSSAPLTGPVLEMTRRMFPKAEILDVFGVTEGGWARLVRNCNRGPDARFHPVARTKVRVAGAAPGEVGRLQVLDPAPPPWYYGEAPGTGWVDTGDHARITSDGGVQLCGRADDVIVSGGLNISPADVEEVLLSQPGVAEAAVVGIPDPILGTAVGAAVVPSGDVPLSAADLRAGVLDRLGTVRTPRRIVIMDDLPRVAQMKVDRRAVLVLVAGSAPAQSDAGGYPAGSVTEVVLTVARDALESPTLDADDDLITAGLDSLAAVKIAVTAGEKLGVKVEAWMCFDFRTARALASRCADLVADR
jgi:acyl-coenzyme A synthetase/AMP-(fatty) acid ligase/acyl carrier protein